MKLIKFDILYPFEYLQQKQADQQELISRMNFDEYNAWLMGLRMGYYDLFGRELKKRNWEGFDLYFQDDLFVFKLAKKFGIRVSIKDMITRKGYRCWKDLPVERVIKAWRSPAARKQLKKHIILRKFIALYQPDIIFLREPCQVDNLFWKPYKDKVFIATMIGCNIGHPVNWQLHNSDLVFTITREYADFFNLNKVPAHLFEYGFDIGLLDELDLGEKKYEVSFVGLLGTADQQKKTELLEAVSAHCNFSWWGPRGPLMAQYPNLERSWRGIVGGKEMYQVYASSRIVLNDYVHSNAGSAVNLRLKEALGVGAFLLTRFAANIADLEEKHVLKFFTDATDCIEKINYYLDHEEERAAVAVKAREYIREHYNNSTILNTIFDRLGEAYQHKLHQH